MLKLKDTPRFSRNNLVMTYTAHKQIGQHRDANGFFTVVLVPTDLGLAQARFEFQYTNSTCSVSTRPAVGSNLADIPPLGYSQPRNIARKTICDKISVGADGGDSRRRLGRGDGNIILLPDHLTDGCHSRWNGSSSCGASRSPSLSSGTTGEIPQRRTHDN